MTEVLWILSDFGLGRHHASPIASAATVTQAATAVRLRAVSERLADYVVALDVRDLPAVVIAHAKDLLVNQLALALRGRDTANGARAIALAHELSAGAGGSTLVGEGRKVTLLDSIFAHSVLIGQLLDDVTFPSGLHIGRITHPVAWIVGERQHASGADLITAVVAGYDVACRLALPALERDYVHMPQNALAPLAAAAVAARMLGLDRARTAHAIAYGAHLGAGLVEGGEAVTSGVIARNGTLAALLAEPRRDGLRSIEGAHGLFATYFHVAMTDFDDALDSLGREYAVMGTSTKRFPGSASHILGLEYTQELMRRASVESDDIERVLVTLSEDFRGRFDFIEPLNGEPDRTPGYTARSLRVKLAVLVAQGRPSYQPTPADLDAAEVRGAPAKIALAFEEGRSLAYARVRLTLRDGRSYEREGMFEPYPKGDWSAWLRTGGSDAGLSDRQIARLERLLAGLETIDDVAEVMACTVPEGPA